MPPLFTHLHVHSDASLKDGLRPVSALVHEAQAKGFKHLALTDHGTLANAIAFSLECQAANIKPIIGMEAYVSVDGATGHLTLLADGEEGFNNLVLLDNAGHASDFKQPAFTVEQLIEHSRGLVLLSGCVASPLNKLDLPDALKLGARLKTAFGPRFFAEAMFVADTDTHSRPLALASRLGLRLVITNDVHFPSGDDAPVHTILTRMKAGYDYNSLNLSLKSANDILARAIPHIGRDAAIEAMERTFAIGNKIAVVNFKRAPKLPHVPKAEQRLREMVMPLATPRGSQYEQRAEYELSIIEKMGFATYFIILKDIIDFSGVAHIRVGPGRGSGAGSLVLFLLGVTQIDPLVYDLPFERFLNPERVGMPDVDVDFDSERRPEVLEYAKKRWKGIPIATYSRYSHKSLVHDLGKMFRTDRQVEVQAADEGPESDAFRRLVSDYEGFGQAYNAIIGQIRHKGTHAGGIIITDQVVPIERVGDDLAASWTEGLHNELSYAGIVKYDLLGLSALSLLHRLEQKFGRHADPPVDKSPVFKLFKKGMLEGIFQFSGSTGIHDLTVKLAPERFDDLVAINALYRPGALDVGATEQYPEWKKHPRKVHPLIADILKPTYGAIVFQEQVMAIFARLTGGTLGAADEARRVIVKSKEHDVEWVRKITLLKDEFVNGAVKHGMKRPEAEELWVEISAHSRYSFNKAHAVSYAMIAWEMAWWKHYHTADFYAELLNVDPTQSQTYLVSAVTEGVTLNRPHVNVSGTQYTAKDGAIYMPLSAIKFLSAHAAASIESARKAGPFTSTKDFMSRIEKKVVRAQARLGLLMLDAFVGLDSDINDLQVKTPMLEMASPAKIQQEFLGVVLPTKELMARIEKAKVAGFVSGIVTQIEEKSSKWGPYRVIRLVPAYTIWERGLMAGKEVKVGDVIAAQVRHESNKAVKIKILE